MKTKNPTTDNTRRHDGNPAFIDAPHGVIDLSINHFPFFFVTKPLEYSVKGRLKCSTGKLRTKVQGWKMQENARLENDGLQFDALIMCF